MIDKMNFNQSFCFPFEIVLLLISFVIVSLLKFFVAYETEW